MAFRYLREGYKTKTYVKHSRHPIRPFINDLVWEATEWQYNHYMGEISLKSLRSSQENINELQRLQTLIVSGEISYHYPHPTNHFFFGHFIPNIVPNLKSTNPFCMYTPNKTGWREVPYNKRLCPQPRKHHKVGGSDPRPSIHINAVTM